MYAYDEKFILFHYITATVVRDCVNLGAISDKCEYENEEKTDVTCFCSGKL